MIKVELLSSLLYNSRCVFKESLYNTYISKCVWINYYLKCQLYDMKLHVYCLRYLYSLFDYYNTFLAINLLNSLNHFQNISLHC